MLSLSYTKTKCTSSSLSSGQESGMPVSKPYKLTFFFQLKALTNFLTLLCHPISETSGATHWNRSWNDLTGPLPWFPIANDQITWLSQTVHGSGPPDSLNKTGSILWSNIIPQTSHRVTSCHVHSAAQFRYYSLCYLIFSLVIAHFIHSCHNSSVLLMSVYLTASIPVHFINFLSQFVNNIGWCVQWSNYPSQNQHQSLLQTLTTAYSYTFVTTRRLSQIISM